LRPNVEEIKSSELENICVISTARVSPSVIYLEKNSLTRFLCFPIESRSLPRVFGETFASGTDKWKLQ